MQGAQVEVYQKLVCCGDCRLIMFHRPGTLTFSLARLAVCALGYLMTAEQKQHRIVVPDHNTSMNYDIPAHTVV